MAMTIEDLIRALTGRENEEGGTGTGGETGTGDGDSTSTGETGLPSSFLAFGDQFKDMLASLQGRIDEYVGRAYDQSTEMDKLGDKMEKAGGSIMWDRDRTLDLGKSATGIFEGTDDAAFGDYRKAVLGQLTAEEQKQQAQQSEFFGRGGLGGSSAELNANRTLAGELGRNRATVTSEIGLQGLARKDSYFDKAMGASAQSGSLAALASGVYGQAAGVEDLALGGYGDVLEGRGMSLSMLLGLFNAFGGEEFNPDDFFA